MVAVPPEQVLLGTPVPNNPVLMVSTPFNPASIWLVPTFALVPAIKVSLPGIVPMFARIPAIESVLPNKVSLHWLRISPPLISKGF